jgi:RNA polymerase sigma factor (sigma-70 family)
MIEMNELNSTFYALRLLSHGLDISEIRLTGGEEYPATEFTEEEQEEALKIIHRIEASEFASAKELPPEKIAFYRTYLAGRIEELANSDLAKAGYNLQQPAATFIEGPSISPESPTSVELATRVASLIFSAAKIDPQQRRFIELVYVEGFSLSEIAEVMDLPVAAVRRKLARAQILLGQALTKQKLEKDTS